MKEIKIFVIMVLVFCLFSSVSADPVVNVDIEPDEPTPTSQITVTADISSEEKIDKVYLEIQECKEDLCFTKENITMNLVNNVYRTSYKLTKKEATYFKYSISIKFENGQWFETEKTDVTLKLISNNGSTNNGNGEDNKTPGFELVLLIVAFIICAFLFKRKRI